MSVLVGEVSCELRGREGEGGGKREKQLYSLWLWSSLVVGASLGDGRQLWQ